MKRLKEQKRHSKAYRRQAVELVMTGRTIADLAQELGVGVATLHRWKEEYLLELAEQPADTQPLPPQKMWNELQRLR